MGLSIDLPNLKKYLRLDPNFTEDDSLIEGFVSASKQLIEEQTGVSYSDSDEVYKLAVQFAVQHYYDNRMSVTDKTITAIPLTLGCLINQIGSRPRVQDD